MDINFELYKIFYFAAKYQNFSEAAGQLYITQSAVSQAIKNLESKLGTSLFLRKTRSLQLTPEGKLLFSHIEQSYNLIRSAEQKLAEIQNLAAGEIRIGASDTVCKYYLLPYLEQFNQQFPQINIQVINRTSSKIIETLKNGLIDFGIITLPQVEPQITTLELIDVADIFVASSRFAKLAQQPVHLQELGSYPLLMLEKNSATRQNFDAYLKRTKTQIVPEIELESVDLLVEFARIGLGVAHVLQESAVGAIKRKELFEVKIIEKLPLRKLGIAMLENVPLSRAASKMIEMLRRD